jgi:hypothetical protein
MKNSKRKREPIFRSFIKKIKKDKELKPFGDIKKAKEEEK